MAIELGDIPALRSAADLNRLGTRLWRAQQARADIVARKARALKRVNDQYDPKLEEQREEIDALLTVIIDYAVAHKDELTETQTVRLDALDIEWRTDGKGTLVFVSPEADIVARLRRLKAGRGHIVVKETVRKDTLKADAVTMGKLGPMVAVEHNDSIIVTAKPSPAQAKRGGKKTFKRTL